jgi:pilus assembly protein Flp/PilA
MNKLIAVAKNALRRQEGASLAEYGLLIALIAVVCLAGVTLLGSVVNSMFSQLSSTI